MSWCVRVFGCIVREGAVANVVAKVAMYIRVVWIFFEAPLDCWLCHSLDGVCPKRASTIVPLPLFLCED